MEKFRILLVDDHPLVRQGLRAMVNLQPDMAVIGEAADGLSAYEQAIELSPDVVVMDLSMPKLSGIEATERLKAKQPKIRVLGFTFHADTTYIRQLLEAGASGCVLKLAVADEVIRAIGIVADGGTYLDPEVADSIVPGGRVGAQAE
jgi:DNA-binding NarL/FixJ family response regulator